MSTSGAVRLRRDGVLDVARGELVEASDGLDGRVVHDDVDRAVRRLGPLEHVGRRPGVGEVGGDGHASGAPASASSGSWVRATRVSRAPRAASCSARW